MHSKTSSTLQVARHFCDSVPYSRDLGIQVMAMHDERAVMTLMPSSSLVGDVSRNFVFSSIALSLADSCSGLAVFVATKKLLPISTLDLRMDYLRAAPAHKLLTASATCFRHTPEIAFVRCLIHSEGLEEPVAIGSSVFVRAKDGGARQDAWKAAVEKWKSPGAMSGVDSWVPVLTTSQSNTESLLEMQSSDHPCKVDDDARCLVAQLPFAQYLGICAAVISGIHCLKMPYRSTLIGNMTLPALHGGALGALMEITALIACQQMDPMRLMPKVVDSTIDYLRSGKARDTYAQAKIVRSGQRVVTLRVECWQDDPGNVIAVMRLQLMASESSLQ